MWGHYQEIQSMSKMYANREGPGHHDRAGKHDFESGKSVVLIWGWYSVMSNVCQWLEKCLGKCETFTLMS